MVDFAGRADELANALLAAGYTNIRRYQLGLPVWRALGGVTEIESEGVRYFAERDKDSSSSRRTEILTSSKLEAYRVLEISQAAA